MVTDHDHVATAPDDFEPIETVPFVGGELCFDFTNTASNRQMGPLRDRLQHYDDLLVWSRRAGVLSDEQADALGVEAAKRPADAARMLERARALRESIYRVFSARAAGADPAVEDVEGLNEALAEAGRLRRVVRGSSGWVWTWDVGDEPLAWPLWPVAHSAGELLTEGDVERIKECRGNDCNWLFYDVSKNRSRRWCEMKDCGNREKQRRHRRRNADTSSTS